MIATLGTIATWGALIGAGVALAASILGAWSGRRGWMSMVKVGLVGAAVLMLVAFGALAMAMVGTDLRLGYVASHVELGLPPVLRFAAVWSGQEGSLLLWATFTAGVGAVIAARKRAKSIGRWVSLATVALVQLVLSGIVVFAASPFELASDVGTDGLGLHPQLQHWAMVIHPPLILLSYALLLAPFALGCGAMVDRDGGRGWAAELRPWVTGAWTCLGLGMLIGAWWAYVELGWGGYWAWDPVENASFMPWLTTTALMHTLGVQRRRGRLARWTPPLATASFALCVLGTYLTRSGVVQSAHAFAQSAVGDYFVALLGVVVLLGGGLYAVRGRVLRDDAWDAELQAGPSPEAARGLMIVRLTQLVNVVLLVLATVVLVGTIFPLLSGWVFSTPAAMSNAYFNRMAGPLGLALVALIAVSAVAPDVSTQPHSPMRKLGCPALAAAGAVILALAAGLGHGLLVFCIALGVFALGVIVQDLVNAIRTFSNQTGFGLGSSTWMVLERFRVQTASRLAHAGAAVLLIGIAGSSLLTRKADATVVVGETVNTGGYELRLDALREIRSDTYTAVEADLNIATRGGVWQSFTPQRRYYDKFAEPVSEVDIRSGARTDLYVAMLGWNGRDQRITVEVHERPLTLWVWIGGGMIVLAGPVSMLPRRPLGRRQRGLERHETGLPISNIPEHPSRPVSRP